MPTERVAIVGGGFSGAMVAVNLARFGGPTATIIERDGVFGPGVAFGGRDRGQVLNVRAANMSAYADDPDHFQRWLAARGQSAGDYARRVDYGRYLAEEIDAAIIRRPGKITRIAQEAVSAKALGQGWRIGISGGTTVDADVLVLASGLAPPAVPPGVDPRKLAGYWIADPWREDFVASCGQAADVLLLGTGLTMIDVALALVDQPEPPRLHALSRRGLLPRPHAAPAAPPRLEETPAPGLTRLLMATRQAAREIGWQAAVDRLRPHTQIIWQRFSLPERKRFLRHLRAFWDVHRHRMAPELHDRIQSLIASGTLTVHAGRLENAMIVDGRAQVSWQIRGTAARAAFDFDRIVNCTGPAPLDGDIAGSPIGGLLAKGIVTPDELGLGLRVDAQSRVIDATGRAQANLYALGALTRGRFWEISAVPDIRVQAWTPARKLANAHWVAGEGL